METKPKDEDPIIPRPIDRGPIDRSARRIYLESLNSRLKLYFYNNMHVNHTIPTTDAIEWMEIVDLEDGTSPADGEGFDALHSTRWLLVSAFLNPRGIISFDFPTYKERSSGNEAEK